MTRMETLWQELNRHERTNDELECACGWCETLDVAPLGSFNRHIAEAIIAHPFGAPPTPGIPGKPSEEAVRRARGVLHALLKKGEMMAASGGSYSHFLKLSEDTVSAAYEILAALLRGDSVGGIPGKPSDAATAAAFAVLYPGGDPPSAERDGPELVALQGALAAAYRVDSSLRTEGQEQ